jgi:hypothetical protein
LVDASTLDVILEAVKLRAIHEESKFVLCKLSPWVDGGDFAWGGRPAQRDFTLWRLSHSIVPDVLLSELS